MTRSRRLVIIPLALICLAASPVTARGADYPVKPVKLIVAAAAGMAGDVIGRIVAEQLGKQWGQSVVVENRFGAGGVVASQAVAQSPADGYTLYLAAASALVIAPNVERLLPFDPETAFAPVGFVAESPLLVGVRSSLEVRSLAELIALATRQPGTIDYAASYAGSFPHLAAERFADQAGVKLTFVPYKGGAQAIPDLVSGRIAMMVEGLASVAGTVKAGQLRPLAVTSAKRLPDLPDVPAVAETVPGFAAVGWFAVMAPGNTPPAILAKIHADLRQVIAQPDVVARFQALTLYPRYMPQAEFAEFIRSERAQWGAVVKKIGFKPQ